MKLKLSVNCSGAKKYNISLWVEVESSIKCITKLYLSKCPQFRAVVEMSMKLNQVKKMETEILEKQLRTTDENLESKSSLMQSQRKVKQHFIEDKWEEKSDFY